MLPGTQAKKERTANGYGLSKGRKMFCTVVLSTQLCECAKNQWRVYFKRVNFMVYEINLNGAVT